MASATCTICLAVVDRQRLKHPVMCGTKCRSLLYRTRQRRRRLLEQLASIEAQLTLWQVSA